VLPFDITDNPSHAKATEKVINTFGQIDVLVNNAGRSQRAWIVDTELAVDREMIELNVIGQISLTKCVLPHMIERHCGQIVVTSSLAGKAALPFSATYCLTKWALNGYFHSLAMEMVPNNISVSVICPGPVFSNLCSVAFTGKSGQTFGQSQENDKSRMMTTRCAGLMAIAIANQLPEVWIARHPPLIFTYLNQYFPTITSMVMRRIGVKQIMSIREGK
jgi:dehydrogenase/reductase SDR family protein 7